MSSILYGIKDVVIDDMINEQVTYKLWENAGRKIMEAQLTADQINQLFANIEQGATAAGGNRTMIGKGKDAASAVNKAWEELKTKIQNSGPIKNVDAMYDQAAEKLKQATGGDEGVNKYVQKYRAFAKKYPVAQSFIYAALISAAGISGAGLGGAAALGLLKMADKLLQGEKFSSAAYSGAKTGAMAYGASKLGDYIKGKMGSDTTTTTTTSGGREVEFDATAMNQNDALVRSAVTSDGKPVWVNTGGGSGYFDEKAAIQYAKEKGFSSFDQAMAANRASQAYARESINLSEVQVALLFEGIFDKIKGAASSAVAKGVSKVQQVGKNITTKVTADKLMSAWKKAGSPTDSEQIVAILTQNGVDKGVIDSVFKQMNIPIGAPAQPQAQVTPKPQAQKPAAKPAAQAAQPAATPQPTAVPAAKPAAQAAQPAATPQPTAAQPAAQKPAQAAPAAKSGKPVTKKPSVANNQTAGVRQQGGAFAYNPLAEGDFEVNVPGYGTMPLEMLKRHVKALANDFNDMVQSEEFIKAAYRTEQFYNALMALAKAMKAKSKDLDETHSTGTSVGSAGIGGGAGLGIDKSPIEKVIEKPLGESLPTSPGGMGQSYRKFTPKSAGVEEGLNEMDKSQPSSSRGAEGLALGKKAYPVKTDKVKSDALKVLQKQYKKTKDFSMKEQGVAEADKKKMTPTSPWWGDDMPGKNLNRKPADDKKKQQGVAEGLVGDVVVHNYTKMPMKLRPGQAQIHGWGPGEQPIYRVKGHDGKEVITSNKKKMMMIAQGQGVAEGAPELLKQEMPLVRHIEKELERYGYEKGTPEYNEMFKHSIAMYRKFGNIDAIKKAMSEEQAPMFTPEEKIVNMNDKKSDGWRVYKAKPAGSKDEVDEVSNFLALRQKDDEFKKIFGTTPLYKEGDSIVTKFSDKTPNVKGVVVDFDPKTKKTLIKTDDGKKYFVHAQNLSKINKESSIMKGLQTEVNTHGSSKGK